MASPVGATSPTAFVETTIMAYCAEAKECYKARRVLSERGQRKLAAAIVEACDAVWPGQPDRPAWLFALKLTETGVGPSDRNPAREEKTYGPFCLTLFAAREAAIVLGIPLPRSADNLITLLQDDYHTSALVAAWNLWALEHQAQDRVKGLLLYKYGAKGLARAMANEPTKPLTDFWPWTRFADRLTEIRCIEDRVRYRAPATCGCLR